MARETAATREVRERRLVGQEDTNLFGGSFTPFRDLWNSLAGDLGITTKRMRTDALERAAEEEAIWRDTSSALTGELERQRSQATNPNDIAQLRVLQTQIDMAGRMRSSSNPKVQEAGLALLGKVTDQQRAYEEQQETQRIAKETTQAAIEREVGSTGFQRMQGISDDLRTESSDFLKQRDAWGAVNAALSQKPSAASDLSLIFTFMKVLDPTSVVREGEFATAQNASGVPALVLTAYNGLLRDGKRLTPDQRREFYDQARARYMQSSAQQRERNGRYLERARAAEVPEKYLDSLTIPVDMPTPAVDFGADGSAFLPPPGSALEKARNLPLEERVDSDTQSTKIGQAIRSGVQTAGGRALDLLKGIVGAGEGGSPEPSDEPPAPPPNLPELLYRRDADLRGIANRREARRRARAGAVSGVIRRPVNE